MARVRPQRHMEYFFVFSHTQNHSLTLENERHKKHDHTTENNGN